MSNITGGQDLEYAFKLASTLRWRTWPEEKPEVWRFLAIQVKGDRRVISAESRICDEYYFWAAERFTRFNRGDQWMYLSDLEVVR